MEIAPDQEIAFDEFARVCDLVDGYFDETVDEVAVRTPVSRQQLVAVLARAQLSGRQRALEGDVRQTDVVYRSRGETLLWFDDGFWTDVGRQHDLDADERRAARAVHRRVIDVIDGDDSRRVRDRDPFVLVERFEPYDSP
ncbi:hypothetical protein [Natronococcus wangiae]|uniref:hypothetical protein n=1 Tax=Natronococcus wangiae TaxID=3068275 RepID=UPI00273FA439|nr:hypothetical protein [Natronococcus sp. AD5]